jgi:hypothetical protein
MTDPAHILFPADAPAMQIASAQRNATALQRAEPAAAPDPAATMFSNDAARAAAPAQTAKETDPAKTLFRDDAKTFDDKPANDFFTGFALSARNDGDADRADALTSAGEALIADAKDAGTDAAELTAALDVVRERQGDTLTPITPEKLEADFATGMAAVQAEFGDNHMADLSAARAFIRHLDTIAPGTIDSLERTGAGNDMRVIRAAIKEAKRRGFK